MATYTNTGVYIRNLWDQLRHNMEIQLRENGYDDISPSHGWIFYNTDDQGSRITDLAAKAKITKQSMSVLVAQLESGGYVTKAPDPTDKRAWLLLLTQKGQKVKTVGQQINYDFEAQWKDKLGPTDYEKFRQFLILLCE